MTETSSRTRPYDAIDRLLKVTGPFLEDSECYDPTEAINNLDEFKILVVGAGGLGCEILKNLALTKFKNIHVIDMDTIDLSNLNRQFLFRQKDVGRPKSEVAARKIKEMIDDDGLVVTAHYCKIQDKPTKFYEDFDIVICGLDSIEARRWINNLLHSIEKIIPMVDGGTEGFRGQSRVIIPGVTSCYECTLDLFPPKTTYPVCTIANTPRLPQHCIEYASVIEWPKNFPDRKFDADEPEDVDWMYATALARANYFKIQGVTRQLTLGVVKNIIPAIASTNAIIAASCCNEVFKIATSHNPYLDNYMMYAGDQLIFTYTFSNSKKKNCPVCGNEAKLVKAHNNWTLQRFIDFLKEQPELQLQNPSIMSCFKSIYMTNPPTLEEATRPNLEKKLVDLIEEGQELSVTDTALPITIKLQVSFIGAEAQSVLNI